MCLPAANGFVLWFDPTASRRSQERVEHLAGTAEGGLVGPGFGIYVRPSACTPETTKEKQPLLSQQLAIVYTGWVANRAKIAGRLDQPELASAPDGAIFGAAYDAWGEAFPAEVLGEYSFALIDRMTGAVVAGRDALGLRRLICFSDDRRIWIASNLELLLSLLPESRPLDPVGLHRGVVEGLYLGEAGPTFYQGIEYLPAGNTVAWSEAGNRVVTRYWRPVSGDVLHYADDRDYEDHLRRVLDRSIGEALRAPQPIFVELSGGLDSSSVAGIAASIGSRCGTSDRLHALSYVSGEPEMDERPYQRAVVELNGLIRYTFDLDDNAEILRIDSGSQAGPEIVQPWLVAGYKSIHQRFGAKICLTGQGGDAVFHQSSLPYFVADLWREGRWREWSRVLRAWPDGRRTSLWELLRMTRQKSFSLATPRPPWLRGIGFEPPADDALSGLLPARRYFLATILRLAATLPEVANLPVETRHPLLSRPLVELVLRLPWSQLVSPSRNRVLQRRALQDILPREVLTRTSKTDFTGRAIRTLAQSRGLQSVHDSGGKWLAELGLIEPEPFSEAVQRLRHGQGGMFLHHLSAAMILECWLAAYDVSPSNPSATDLPPLANRVCRQQ